MSALRTPREQDDRRSRLGIVLAILLVAIVLAALLVAFRQRTVQTYALDLPYDLQKQNGAERLSEFAQQTANPFAQELITVEGDVNVRRVKLPQEDSKALLFDLENNEAVYANRVYQKVYPASLTKMMTAVLALENTSMNEMITMTEADFDLEEGAQVSALEPGDVVSMNTLFHLLVIYSANDAAMAIARNVGGDIPYFVEMMNERAAVLGMTGTHFTNPTGLHDPEMYTTAYDIYLMMRQAYSYQNYLNVSQMSEYSAEVHGEDGIARNIYHASTDEYLTKERTLPAGTRILASKTGTTDQAGSCLALVIQNEYGVPYIAIVMGAYSKDLLYGNMTSLIELT